MYNKKIKSPVYEIKGEKPKLSELVDSTKATNLILEISESGAPAGIKAFLIMAATRHYKFDYQKIAEYYANSSSEVQLLFEKSALVIPDFDSAIENGFVMMNKRLMEVREDEPQG